MIIIIKVNVKNVIHTILMVLLLIYILIPPFFVQVIYKHSILHSLIMVVSLTLICAYIVKYGLRVDSNILVITAYYVCFIVSTRKNSGLVHDAFSNGVFIVLLCLLLNNFIDHKAEALIFIKKIRNITCVLFVVNCLLTIAMPSGIPVMSRPGAPGFLYGNMNSTIKYIFPGLCCSLILDSQNKKVSAYTVTYFLGMAFLIFHVYFMATTFVGIAVILIWTLFYKKLNKNPKLLFSIILLTVFLFEILICCGSGNKFSSMLTSLFGKDVTFSGRAHLWDNIIRAITQHPMLGHGLQSTDFVHSMVGNRAGSHNYYLDVLFQRGIIGLLLFLSLVFAIWKYIPWKKPLAEIEYILLGVCSAYLVMFLMEPYNNYEKFFIPIFFVLLELLYPKKKILVNILSSKQD